MYLCLFPPTTKLLSYYNEKLIFNKISKEIHKTEARLYNIHPHVVDFKIPKLDMDIMAKQVKLMLGTPATYMRVPGSSHSYTASNSALCCNNPRRQQVLARIFGSLPPI